MARRDFDELPGYIKDAVYEFILKWMADPGETLPEEEIEFYLDAHKEYYESGLYDYVVDESGELQFTESPTSRKLKDEGLFSAALEMRFHMLQARLEEE